MCMNEHEIETEHGETLNALRDVLRPEPLPASLVARIEQDWDARGGRTRIRLAPWRTIGLAAAAALLIAVLYPAQFSSDGGSTMAITQEEARLIAAAWGTVEMADWDATTMSGTTATIESVGESLVKIERQLTGERSDSRLLPWGRDDDWDMPPASEQDASRARRNKAVV